MTCGRFRRPSTPVHALRGALVAVEVVVKCGACGGALGVGEAPVV